MKYTIASDMRVHNTQFEAIINKLGTWEEWEVNELYK